MHNYYSYNAGNIRRQLDNSLISANNSMDQQLSQQQETPTFEQASFDSRGFSSRTRGQHQQIRNNELKNLFAPYEAHDMNTSKRSQKRFPSNYQQNKQSTQHVSVQKLRQQQEPKKNINSSSDESDFDLDDQKIKRLQILDSVRNERKIFSDLLDSYQKGRSSSEQNPFTKIQQTNQHNLAIKARNSTPKQYPKSNETWNYNIELQSKPSNKKGSQQKDSKHTSQQSSSRLFNQTSMPIQSSQKPHLLDSSLSKTSSKMLLQKYDHILRRESNSFNNETVIQPKETNLFISEINSDASKENDMDNSAYELSIHSFKLDSLQAQQFNTPLASPSKQARIHEPSPVLSTQIKEVMRNYNDCFIQRSEERTSNNPLSLLKHRMRARDANQLNSCKQSLSNIYSNISALKSKSFL